MYAQEIEHKFTTRYRKAYRLSEPFRGHRYVFAHRSIMTECLTGVRFASLMPSNSRGEFVSDTVLHVGPLGTDNLDAPLLDIGCEIAGL